MSCIYILLFPLAIFCYIYMLTRFIGRGKRTLHIYPVAVKNCCSAPPHIVLRYCSTCSRHEYECVDLSSQVPIYLYY